MRAIATKRNTTGTCDPTSMNLKIERIFADFEFDVWQIGGWQHTITKDGEHFWEWWGGNYERRRVLANSIRERAESAEELRPPPILGLLGRP